MHFWRHHVHDSFTGARIADCAGPAGEVLNSAFNGRGAAILNGYNTGAVLVMNARTLTVARRLTGCSRYIHDVLLSGPRAIAASTDKCIYVWTIN
jgi:hypothetical protein